MPPHDQNRDQISVSRNRPRAQYLPADPLLTARQAAAELGKGLSTFWRDVRSGQVPKPYYVSERSPRWRRSELKAAIEGMPRTAARRCVAITTLRRPSALVP